MLVITHSIILLNSLLLVLFFYDIQYISLILQLWKLDLLVSGWQKNWNWLVFHISNLLKDLSKLKSFNAGNEAFYNTTKLTISSLICHSLIIGFTSLHYIYSRYLYLLFCKTNNDCWYAFVVLNMRSSQVKECSFWW